MCKYISIIIIAVILSSCATLLNDKKTYVVVSATKPVTIIYKTDTLNTSSVTLGVTRSRKPLEITVISDSLKKEISTPATLSKNFYLNVIPYFWPGIAVDLITQEAYTYRNINLDNNLNQLKGSKSGSHTSHNPYFANKKGDFHIAISSPFVNITQTTIVPNNSSRQSFGTFFGFAGGLEYVYKDNRSINLTGNISYSLGSMRTLIDYCTDKSRGNSYSLALTHNHAYRKLSYGYGLSYTYHDWWSRSFSFDNTSMNRTLVYDNGGYYNYTEYYDSSQYSTLGFTLNGYYNIYRPIHFGVVYRPSILRLKPMDGKHFVYEHQITFDVLFKFKIGR